MVYLFALASVLLAGGEIWALVMARRKNESMARWALKPFLAVLGLMALVTVVGAVLSLVRH